MEIIWGWMTWRTRGSLSDETAEAQAEHNPVEPFQFHNPKWKCDLQLDQCGDRLDQLVKHH